MVAEHCRQPGIPPPVPGGGSKASARYRKKRHDAALLPPRPHPATWSNLHAGIWNHCPYMDVHRRTQGA